MFTSQRDTRSTGAFKGHVYLLQLYCVVFAWKTSPKGKVAESTSPQTSRDVAREGCVFVSDAGTKSVDFPKYLANKDLIYLTLGKERKYNICMGLQIKSPEGIRRPSFWSYLLHGSLRVMSACC